MTIPVSETAVNCESHGKYYRVLKDSAITKTTTECKSSTAQYYFLLLQTTTKIGDSALSAVNLCYNGDWNCLCDLLNHTVNSTECLKVQWLCEPAKLWIMPWTLYRVLGDSVITKMFVLINSSAAQSYPLVYKLLPRSFISLIAYTVIMPIELIRAADTEQKALERVLHKHL